MKTITLAAAAFLLAGTAQSATLVNGSLTGPTGVGSPPPGWQTVSFSPDTNDTAINGFFTYVSPPGVSNDGGTWVGIAAGFGFESFGQTITDFVVGQSYTLLWEQFNSGATFSSGYTNPNSVAVRLDGTVVGSGISSSLGEGWVNTSATFTATSTTHLLSFALTTNTPSYMNIDGIAFATAPTSEVPLPASGLMLLTAAAGLALRRKRKS